jgi:hypothetical protein
LIVSGLAKHSGPVRTRVSALVTWEDSARPPVQLFFETDSEHADSLNPEPNAFLLAGILPAFRHGERRLRVDGEICPRLIEGLETVMRLHIAWRGPGRRPVEIEPTGGRRASLRAPARSGMFLTGGVDSLHTLWWNRNHYAHDHPAAFRDALYIEGVSFPEETPSPRNRDVTRRQIQALAAIGAGTGLTVITFQTNIRRLELDNTFVAEEAMSSLLASAAHAAARRLTSVSFGAGLDLATLRPWGTHPLLDLNYCSSAVELHQEDWTLDRLTKIRRIAGWKTALTHMMVCFEGPLENGTYNCGSCEKCVRTMMGLLIAGRLDLAGAFPRREITVESLERLDPGYHVDFLPYFWRPLIEPLNAIGRKDLAAAVRRLIARAQRRQRWLEERDWKGKVRRFDRAHLGGILLRASRRARGLSPIARES